MYNDIRHIKLFNILHNDNNVNIYTFKSFFPNQLNKYW